MLSKQQRTANKEWSSSLGAESRTKTST